MRQMDQDEARQKLLAKINHAASVFEEEKFEKQRAARLAEALAGSSIGEEDGYRSDDAQFFLANRDATL